MAGLASISEEPQVRSLSTCSFNQALQAWNEGFQGYFVDMTLSLNGFLARLYREGLSVENSLIAFSAGRPAGLLLNGIRVVDEKKIAWNGGTGVSPKFRGCGVGKALMRSTLELYQQQNVQLACLEAIAENHKAISLYQQFGYEIVDRLLFWERNGKLDASSFAEKGRVYRPKNVAPQRIGKLNFYQNRVPWQSLWQSVQQNNGEAMVILDASGLEAGYALYKRKFDEQGKLTSIALSQCVANPERADEEAIVSAALGHVFAPLETECHRTTYNLSAANKTVLRLLGECGFKSFIEQVHMVLRL